MIYGEEMEEKYLTVIKPKTGWFDIDLKEVWRYKDLVFMFVKRNFVLQYKQTILGPLWLILNPLMTSVIFTFIFGNFANISTDGVPPILFYMAGNTMWGVFAATVNGTSNTFTLNAGMFGKIYFPRITVPVAQSITAMVNFFIQFAMLMCFFAFYWIKDEIQLTANVIFIPVLLLHTTLLGLAVGIIVSSVTTKYRDLAIAVGFGVQLWMYATPIVYPLGETGGYMRKILLLNPMTSIINNFRYVLLSSGEFLIRSWRLSWIVTLGLLMLGIILFSRIEKTFMDTV